MTTSPISAVGLSQAPSLIIMPDYIKAQETNNGLFEAYFARAGQGGTSALIDGLGGAAGLAPTPGATAPLASYAPVAPTAAPAAAAAAVAAPVAAPASAAPTTTLATTAASEPATATAGVSSNPSDLTSSATALANTVANSGGDMGGLFNTALAGVGGQAGFNQIVTNVFSNMGGSAGIEAEADRIRKLVGATDNGTSTATIDPNARFGDTSSFAVGSEGGDIASTASGIMSGFINSGGALGSQLQAAVNSIGGQAGLDQMIGSVMTAMGGTGGISALSNRINGSTSTSGGGATATGGTGDAELDEALASTSMGMMGGMLGGLMGGGGGLGGLLGGLGL